MRLFRAAFAKNYRLGDINLIVVDAYFLRQEQKAALKLPRNMDNVWLQKD